MANVPAPEELKVIDAAPRVHNELERFWLISGSQHPIVIGIVTCQFVVYLVERSIGIDGETIKICLDEVDVALFCNSIEILEHLWRHPVIGLDNSQIFTRGSLHAHIHL